MAERYGTTPSGLLRQTLGDFALDVACFERWAEESVLKNKGGFSKQPPKWGG